MILLNPYRFAQPAGDTSLLARYELDDNALDSSGNGHDGTEYNTTYTTDRNGNSLSALQLNGSSTWIDINDVGTSEITGEITLMCWFRVTGTFGSSGRVMIAHTRLTAAEPYYAIGMYGFSGSLNIGAFITLGTGNHYTAPAYGISTYTWYHMAVTFDRTLSTQRLKVYINGSVVTFNNAEDADILFPADSSWRIGRLYNSYYLAGQLDDCRIYNRALSQTEINDIYTA